MKKIVKFEGKEFFKSTFSGAGHSCVGVSIAEDNISIINTNIMDKTISFTDEEWKAFIKGVKNNEFDI